MGVKVPIVIWSNRDWSFSFVWKDSNDAAIDITGYGAIVTVKDKYGNDAKPLFRGDEDDTVNVGTTDGKFDITIPAALTKNWGITKGVWEMTVFPDAADPTSNPQVLVFGPVTYRKSIGRLS